MAAKILVLGATGNIGGLVAKELLDRKLSVAVGVRKPTEKAAESLKSQGAELRKFDLDTKDDDLETSLKGIDRLFLLLPFVEHLFKETKRVVDASKKAGVKHIVKLSAIGADSKSALHVAKEHGESDAYLKASGVGYTILQPTFFYSNFLWQANSIAAQGVYYGSAGKGKATFISPRDIAHVAAHVLATPEKHQSQVYVLTGSEILSSDDVASTLSLVLQKSVKYVDLSPEDHKSSLLKIGTPAWQADDVIGLEQVKKNEWTATVDLSVKKVTGSWPQSFSSWVEENKAAFTLTVQPLSDSAKKRAAGQVAVVTGANRGIGLAIVKTLAKLGVRVVLTARDEKSSEIAAKLQKEGLDVHFHVLDVSSEASVAKLKQYLEKEHKGKVDLLVNNAGVVSSLKDDFFGSTPQETGKVFDTNVLGSIRVLQAVADLIKTHNSGTGRIINVSSFVGRFSVQDGWGFPYKSSKLALNAATVAAAQTVQRDEKTKNLHIVAVCPGPVETDMMAQAGVDKAALGSLGLKILSPEQAADDIVTLALSDKFADFHGKFFEFGKEIPYY